MIEVISWVSCASRRHSLKFRGAQAVWPIDAVLDWTYIEHSAIRWFIRIRHELQSGAKMVEGKVPTLNLVTNECSNYPIQK